MKTWAYILFALVLFQAAPCRAGEAADNDESIVLERVRSACVELGSTLKTRLLSAVQDGNYTGALQVCQTEAPILTAEISKRLGLTVRRTTLKTRNASNLPRPWERKGLESLKQQIAGGTTPDKAEVFECVACVHGEKESRYMKPIMTGSMCLTCHGTAIDPVLQQEIRTRYPGDQATGYKLGELRGAFSVHISCK